MCDFLVLAERPLLFAVCQSNSSGKIRRIDSDAHAVRDAERTRKGQCAHSRHSVRAKVVEFVKESGPCRTRTATSWFVG